MDSGTTDYMAQALIQAYHALEKDEVPVGAVIVDRQTSNIIARAHNLVETNRDPTAHAEILVIQQACSALNTVRLPQCDLYVTLEPCAMCATAISHARIQNLYFGAYDPKGGGVDHGARIFDHSTCHHKPNVYGGIQEQNCAQILKDFFQSKR